MMRIGPALLMVLPLLMAQAPLDRKTTVESVTVTGEKAQEAARKLVKSLAATARVGGHITRWQDGICPITVGLRPAAVKFINHRLRAVAAQVGAPVNPKGDCTPNIEIVFTTAPQALMDNVRKVRPQLLGYADSEAQIAALAKFTRPVQAWYTTQTRDLEGDVVIDMAHRKRPPQDGVPPDAIVVRTSGSRLGDGLTSDFYHVLVAADPTKISDYPIGQITDYIALLALSHVDAPDACQTLSSIINLLAPGCANIPDGLSDTDLAYLSGLYRKMNAGLSAGLQRGTIASQIEADTLQH